MCNCNNINDLRKLLYRKQKIIIVRFSILENTFDEKETQVVQTLVIKKKQT